MSNCWPDNTTEITKSLEVNADMCSSNIRLYVSTCMKACTDIFRSKVGADIISHHNKSENTAIKALEISFLSGPSVDLRKFVLYTPSIQGIRMVVFPSHGGENSNPNARSSMETVHGRIWASLICRFILPNRFFNPPPDSLFSLAEALLRNPCSPAPLIKLSLST